MLEKSCQTALIQDVFLHFCKMNPQLHSGSNRFLIFSKFVNPAKNNSENISESWFKTSSPYRQSCSVRKTPWLLHVSFFLEIVQCTIVYIALTEDFMGKTDQREESLHTYVFQRTQPPSESTSMDTWNQESSWRSGPPPSQGIREGVKKRKFTVRLTVRGRGGGKPPWPWP